MTENFEPKQDAVVPLRALPIEWEWADLGNVGLVRLGKTPRKIDYRDSGVHKIIKFRDVDEYGGVDWNNGNKGYVDSSPEVLRTLKELQDGDVLVTASAHMSEHIGKKVGIVSTIPGHLEGAYVVGEILQIRANEGIHPKWVLYYLRSIEGYKAIQRRVHGVHLIASRAQRIEIPVAPYHQQKRIIEEIEEQFSRLDEAVANLKRVKANLKRYKAAVLKAAVEGKLTEEWSGGHPGIEPASALIERVEQPTRPNRYKTRSKDLIPGHPALAVGNPGTPLPAGWVWVPLVDIARMESGHTPSRRHPEWWDGDVAWIGIADAREHDGKVINDTQQHTNADGLANSAARLLPAGTVCVSRTASVGYVVVMGKDMATSQDFVNWVPTEAVSSDWLRIVFSADREALRRFGKGSVHKTIYFPEWLSVHIALPPREEQDTIVADVERRLTSLEQFDSTLVANGVRAERLRQSILAFSFKGL